MSLTGVRPSLAPFVASSPPYTGSSSAHHYYQSNHNKKDPIRSLTWEDDSQWHILTRLYGSVWPQVWPWCLAMVFLTIVLHIFQRNGYDFTSTPMGHRYLGMLVSFLTVTRIKISYGNYMEQAKHVSNLYTFLRELIQNAVVLTSPHTNAQAVQWRQDVCLQAMHLLDRCMLVLESRSQIMNGGSTTTTPTVAASIDTATTTTIPKELSSISKKTPVELSIQTIPLLALALRKTLLQYRAHYFPGNEHIRLLDSVTGYNQSWSGLEKFITTPLPFPLVQMNKTVLYVWLFSLPFVLLHDSTLVDSVVMITMITLGFIGLEKTSMELSDIFGDDPNDLDHRGYADLCLEDIYICIFKLDGEGAAQDLRNKFLLQATTHAQANDHILEENDLQLIDEGIRL